MPELILTQEIFDAQYVKIRNIAALGGWAAFWKGTLELADVTRSANGRRGIICIDGRIHEPGALISIPGALLGRPDELSEQIVSEGNVNTLYSHGNGCGAAQLVMGKTSRYADAQLTIDLVDTYADTETRDLAHRLHITYGGQLSAQGPHKEVVIYISELLDFNPRPHFTTVLPEGFVLCAALQTIESVLSDLELALSIVFRAGGVGDFLSVDQPLTLVPITLLHSDLEHQLRKFLQVLYRRSPQYDGMISVATSLNL